MKRYPKISIITPTLNQAKFIKQTIESVLSQNYPNLEYIVIDGGSTDETLKILQKYSKHLKWISEKDKGQADAINKGLKLATGDILAYLNSDDLYTPNTLLTVGEYFLANPHTHWLTGDYQIIDENNNPISKQSLVVNYKKFLLHHYHPLILKLTNSIIPQPSTFWSKKAYQSIGEFDINLHYAMDYDYWVRLSNHFSLHYLPQTLSSFRVYSGSKSTTGTKKQFQEEIYVLKKAKVNPFLIKLHQFHTLLTLTTYKVLR